MSDPPLGARAPTSGEQATVDSGWSSLPPASSYSDATRGARPLPSKRRAEGTLLGVAPPRSPAAVPSLRNPVVVHAGISTADPLTEAFIAVPAGEKAPPIPTLPVRAPERKIDDEGLPELGRDVTDDRLAVAAGPVAAAPSLLAPPQARPQHDPWAELAHEVAPVLKPPVAPNATGSRHEPGPLQLFQALSLPVRSLGVELPLWVLLVPPLVSLLTVCAFSAFAAGSRRLPPSHAVAGPSPASIATAEVPSVMPGVDTRAMEAKAPESRTAAEVMALAAATADKKREAAARFNQHLLQTPTSLQKKSTVAELRKLTVDPATAQQTLAAVANLPGPVGPDLLYELWSGTPNKTDGTELAHSLLLSQDVRSKASDALSVALQLRAIGACDEVGALLERARQVGDKRSLSPLAKWKRKRVCAATDQRDCCSSASAKDIAATIDAVKSRRAPFEGM